MEAEFLALEGEFTIRQGTELIDYTRISDIPEKFDHVIKFCPKIPKEPHDINDHIPYQPLYRLSKYVTGKGADVMPAVTRKGDADTPHCSGMTRSGCSPNVFCNGIGISRQGDNNTSHLVPSDTPCPTHSAAIAVGSTAIAAE